MINTHERQVATKFDAISAKICQTCLQMIFETNQLKKKDLGCEFDFIWTPEKKPQNLQKSRAIKVNIKWVGNFGIKNDFFFFWKRQTKILKDLLTWEIH